MYGQIELDIDLEDKITRIKEKVEEQSGVPPPQQRLIFGGRQMNLTSPQDQFSILFLLHAAVLEITDGCCTYRNRVIARQKLNRKVYFVCY